jgi:hypothetical protein
MAVRADGVLVVVAAASLVSMGTSLSSVTVMGEVM